MFIFGTITQFQTWYVLWVFTTIVWQKRKTIYTIIKLTTALEFSNMIYFILENHIQYTIYYYCILVALLTLMNIPEIRKRRMLKKKEKIDKLS